MPLRISFCRLANLQTCKTKEPVDNEGPLQPTLPPAWPTFASAAPVFAISTYCGSYLVVGGNDKCRQQILIRCLHKNQTNNLNNSEQKTSFCINLAGDLFQAFFFSLKCSDNCSQFPLDFKGQEITSEFLSQVVQLQEVD